MNLYLLLLGLAAGVLSGLIGIGGGIIVIPALVLFFHFSQHQAQGTTLAMLLPPIGLFAAWAYWRAGFVDIKAAALLALGFVLGGYLGALGAIAVPKLWLTRVFGATLLIISVKMLWTR
jgi:uncharacterized protein